MLNQCVKSGMKQKLQKRVVFNPYLTLGSHQYSSAVAFQSSQQQEQKSQKTNSSYMKFLLPTLAFTSYLYCNQDQITNAESPTRAENQMGVKENKIRFFGTPREIFKQFASKEDDEGALAMSYDELFKALCPYNYRKPKETFDDYYNENPVQVDKIIKIADADQDGTISFTEFFFFVMVVQTPSRVIKEDFKKMGGKMNLNQMSNYIRKHRKKTEFGQKLKQNQKIRAFENDFVNTNKMMCIRIFGGKEEITCEQYLEFRNKLQEMIWHYEFYQFEEEKKGQISCYDFVQSLYVYYFPFHMIDTYLDHLSQFPQHKHEKITVEQYCAFQYFLKQRALIIDYVMTKGKIDIDGLKSLVKQFQEENSYCKQNKVEIPESMLLAFIDAMDLNANGILEADEVIGILQMKKDIGSGRMGLTKK